MIRYGPSPSGEERLAGLLQSTDYIRYSTTQGTNALVQRQGPRLGLLVTDPELIGRLTSAPAQRELLDALVGDRWAAVGLAGDEELSAELVTTINDLAGRGASRLVVSIGGEAGPPAGPGGGHPLCPAVTAVWLDGSHRPRQDRARCRRAPAA